MAGDSAANCKRAPLRPPGRLPAAESKKEDAPRGRGKVENQMEWVGRMNSIRFAAEEIVNTEIIFA